MFEYRTVLYMKEMVEPSVHILCNTVYIYIYIMNYIFHILYINMYIYYTFCILYTLYIIHIMFILYYIIDTFH